MKARVTIGALACDIDTDSLCDVEEKREAEIEAAPMKNSDKEAVESEAVKARCVKAPIRPSDAEVEEHMVTHLPFRAWCKHCVRGKSKAKKHSAAQKDHVVPTLAVDYMFMHSTQRISEEKECPSL